MKTPADQAIDNAVNFECKKDGLQQRQSGDWVLRITVQALDMHSEILSAPMGTRFQCVLVEINDDETPVDHRAMERDRWRDLGPAQQAGMRCKEPAFWAFIVEEYTDFMYPCSEKDAAEFVRAHCNVASRSDLNKAGFGEQRLTWHNLDNEYQAWKVKEHA